MPSLSGLTKLKKIAFSLLTLGILFLAAGFGTLFFIKDLNLEIDTNNITYLKNPNRPVTITPTPAQQPKVELPQTPASKVLTNGQQFFQTFNNCGPASLSMALSYFGISKPQSELGQELRPWQVPGGDNDDKSVTLEELAEKSKEFGFAPFHRPIGNPETIKQFIVLDLPVITRTWTKPNEDIGHYRVIKGYDTTGFIQDDSLQGKDLHYTFDEFDAIWKQFNYEYLVLVPQEKVAQVEQVLGENADIRTAWSNAVKNAESELQTNPNDIHTRFNLSVALYNIGEYERSTKEFEQVENSLSFRTLWYQIEPIQAYYKLGKYNRVFEITNKVLNTHNRAFSELYIIRGNIYKNQGNIEAARNEFEQAVKYNVNLKLAQDALASVSQ